MREEFKQMTGLSSRLKQWSDADWPWNHPPWYTAPKPLYERAQKRANRRIERKLAKVARAQAFKRREQIPGAWPI